MNVTPISPDLVPVGMPDNEIVDRLRDLLNKAEAGEIRAVAFVAMAAPNVSLVWFKAHPPLLSALVGRLFRMMTTMNGDEA